MCTSVITSCLLTSIHPNTERTKKALHRLGTSNIYNTSIGHPVPVSVAQVIMSASAVQMNTLDQLQREVNLIVSDQIKLALVSTIVDRNAA